MVDFEKGESGLPVSTVENEGAIEARIQEGAGRVLTFLSRLGTGEPLNPMIRNTWMGDDKSSKEVLAPPAILDLLKRLSEGESVFSNEITPREVLGGEYFSGLFRSPNDRMYEELYAFSIYPIARKLDEDLKKKYSELT